LLPVGALQMLGGPFFPVKSLGIGVQSHDTCPNHKYDQSAKDDVIR
jgi:hypothetical protein